MYVEFGPLAAVSSQFCQGSLPPGRRSYLCVLLLSGPQATSKRRGLVFILSRVYLGAGSLVTTDSVLESTWRLLAIWFKAGVLCHRAKGIQKEVIYVEKEASFQTHSNPGKSALKSYH